MVDRKYLYLIVGLIALIIIGTTLFLFFKRSPQTSPFTAQNKQTVTSSPAPYEPTLQVSGKIKEFNNKQITVDTAGKTTTFTVVPETIYYKCQNLNDSSSCKQENTLQNGLQTTVLAKGGKIQFILYK